MKDVKSIIEGFFNGVCDIFEFIEYKDDFGIIQSEERLVLENIPCRVYYKNTKAAIKGKVSDYVTQKVSIMVGRDIYIKNGSVIKVTQNGYTAFYQKTGEAAIYDNHREIEASLKNMFS